MIRVLMVVAGLLLPTVAGAVEPGEMIDDPRLEQQAREVSKDLRCVVCQNQSIDDSNAELAQDMRRVVRDKVREGWSNERIKEFMVDRYGDYVLLDPPMKPKTYILWFGPLVLLLAAVAAAVGYYRRRDTGKPRPLSAEEKRRVEALMKEDRP